MDLHVLIFCVPATKSYEAASELLKVLSAPARLADMAAKAREAGIPDAAERLADLVCETAHVRAESGVAQDEEEMKEKLELDQFAERPSHRLQQRLTR